MINIYPKKKPYKVRLNPNKYIVLSNQEFDGYLNQIYQQTKQKEKQNGKSE